MKMVTVLGARPQFIKACMLSRLLQDDDNINEIIVHTGQHYDKNMSDVFFTQLQLPAPDYNLGAGSGSHGKQTAAMMVHLEEVINTEKPDLVLVYGDTNSTLAGSLAASKLHVPVAHVEAGLRSFNKRMPEEINRVVTDHLSTILFAPSQAAVDHLAREGISDGVYQTGDIMYDAVLHYKEKAFHQSDILERLQLEAKDYYLATVHRAENTDEPNRLKNIVKAFQQLDKKVVFPLHPRTKRALEKGNEGTNSNILFIEPLNYLDMLVMESQAKTIFTDSGGIQKEAYMLRTPCITLRKETEWAETVREKWNTLLDPADLSEWRKAVADVNIPHSYPPLFGDGNAAGQIYRIVNNLPFAMS
ncbi:non-hydrolyzing UDP-N-acetylglucosamine 2-epimerase [Salibacterium halotolerans]|uniref:UDP-GlcNAc3NAcA epimerase n=1 Tax=Salibacterium halotolerans TaxID=1884432 RepID=A0A1I5XJ34_9BACI|nr:UDP-N-acetylglucosamine 2-epimerase (non-hydrolyzing) [Salibacterium halotolerans]SFQ31667.1 UDP-GlcNAc3NAcA epimerase [Salibacterium halotolerans]